MTRVALVLVLLTACFRQHDTTGAIADSDCVVCHRPEFDAAANHLGQGSTKCAACHAVTAEPPWAFAHRSQPFSIATGKHSQFAKDCHTCHSEAISQTDYIANIDCYGGGACHADSHHRDPARPGRCFECHPSGNAGD